MLLLSECVLIGLLSASPLPTEVEKIRQEYEQGCNVLVEEYSRKIMEKYQAYLQSLENLRTKAEKENNSTLVSAVNSELERVKKENEILGELWKKRTILESKILSPSTIGTEKVTKGTKKQPSAPAVVTEQVTPVQTSTTLTGRTVSPIFAVTHSAVNCKVKVSTTHYGLPGESGPEALVDGNLLTRWSSDYAEPQEIELELEKPIVVTKIRLHWEKACAVRYTVSVSSDREAWKKIYFYRNDDVTPQERIDEINVNKIEARYIRIELEKRVEKNWGFSLYEIEVVSAK
jgi:hypothetical protein